MRSCRPPFARHIASAVLLVFAVLATRPSRAQTAGPQFDAGFAPDFRSSDAAIHAVVREPDGRLTIGGNFHWVNEAPRPHLARLQPDGTLDPMFASSGAPNGAVLAMARLPDGRLLITGEFTHVGATPRAFIARLLADGTVDPTFVPAAPNAAVRNAVVTATGAILIAGDFTAVGGTARVRLARLLADGALDTLFDPGFGVELSAGSAGTVAQVVALPDDRVLIGGDFMWVNRTPRQGIAMLRANGTVDPGWSAEGVYRANSVSVDPRGGFYVGGSIAAATGGNAQGLARLLTDGRRDVTYVSAVATADPAVPLPLLPLPDGTLLAAINDRYHPHTRTPLLARFDHTAEAVGSFLPTLGNWAVIDCAARAGDAVLVAGRAASPGEDGTALRLLDPNDGHDTGTLRVQLARRATLHTSVPLPDGRWMVAGDFDRVNGRPLARLARLLPGGTPDPTWVAPQADGAITHLILLPDGRMVVGGRFTSIGGRATAGGIARVNADGTVDGTFANAPAYSPLTALARAADGRLLVARYTEINRLSPDGVPEDSTRCYVYPAVKHILPLPSGGFVYAGGDGFGGFTATDDRMTESPAQTAALVGGSISAIARDSEGHFWLGGTFTDGGTSSRRLLRFASSGGVLALPNLPSLDGPVHSLAPAAAGGMLVGGGFATVDGTARPGVVQLAADGAPAGTFAPAFAARSVSTGLVADGTGDLLVLGDVRLADGTARAVARLTASPLTVAPASLAGSPTAGARLTLAVAATGANLTYQWLRNGIVVTGATSASYELPSFDPATQAGSYACVVTSGGVVRTSDPVVIAALTAPIIQRQPAPLVSFAGGPARFSVEAGGGPLQYQWQRDSVNLAGATNRVLRIEATATGDAGSYRVIVRNPAGEATSSPALLAVHSLVRSTQGLPALHSYAADYDRLKVVPGAGGRVYLSGAFSRVGGRSVPSPVRITAAGAVDTTFVPAVRGAALLETAAGNVLVAETVGASSSVRLRLLGPTGALVGETATTLSHSATVISMPLTLRAREVAGRIMITGAFTAVEGVPRGGAARLLADGRFDPTYVPDVAASHGLTRIDVHGGVYMAPPNGPGIVRLDPDGRRDLTFGEVALSSGARDFHDQTGGNLLVLDGSSRLHRFDRHGRLDPTFTLTGVSDERLTLQDVAADGRIWITTGVQPVRLSPNGAAEQGLRALAATRIIALPGGGALSMRTAWLDGMTQDPPPPSEAGIWQLSATDGSRVPTYRVQLAVEARVTWLAGLPGGSYFVAGNFDLVDGVTRPGLARIKADGTLDATFSPAAGNMVGFNPGVARPDGALWLRNPGPWGSTTDTWRLLQPDGSPSPAGDIAIIGHVSSAAAASDCSVLLGGRFVHVAGMARVHLARLLPGPGGVDPGFAPAAATSDGVIALGTRGDAGFAAAWAAADGNTTIATYTAAGQRTAIPAVAVAGQVSTITPSPGSGWILAGGFNAAGGSPARGLARIDQNGAVDPDFGSDLLLNSGSFGEPASLGNRTVMRATYRKTTQGNGYEAFLLTPWGERDRSFAPVLNPVAESLQAPVSVIARSAGEILLGGAFATVDGQPAAGLARFVDPMFNVTFAEATRLVAPGDTLALTVGINGSGPFSFQWRKDGVPIAGATGSTLSVPNVTSAAAGRYSLAIGGTGFTHETEPIVVSVAAAPLIIQAPADASAAPGETVRLTVNAVGTAPLTYQWWHDGAALPGATLAALTLTNVQPGQAGTYNVVVRNAAGATNGGPAHVAIAGWHLDAGFRPTLGAAVAQATLTTFGAACALPDGGLLVGGNFTSLGGIRRRLLARIDASGAVDPSFDPGLRVPGFVTAIARRPDGRILVQSGDRLVGLAPDGAADPGFQLDPAISSVKAFALRSDGGAYVLGQLPAGVDVRLLRILPDGRLDPAFVVSTVAFGATWLALRSDGGVVVGYSSGLTLPSGGGTVLQRFLPNGQLDANYMVPPGLAGALLALVPQPDDRLVVMSSSRLCRLLPDGQLDASFMSHERGYHGGFQSLHADAAGQLYVSGLFQVLAAQPANGLARLRADGTFIDGVPTGDVAHFACFAVLANGRMLASRATNVPTADSLYWMDAQLRPERRFPHSAAAVAPVRALALTRDGGAFVAGEFDEVEGVPTPGLIVLDRSGHRDPQFHAFPFNLSFQDQTQVAVQSDGRLLVRGSFTEYAGMPRRGLVRLFPTGALDTTFDPAANGATGVFAIDGSDRLLIARTAMVTGGGSEPQFVRYSSTGALDATFAPLALAPHEPIRSIALAPDGAIIVVGSRRYGATERPHGIARLTANGIVDASFNPALGDTAYVQRAVPLPDGRIVAVGNFERGAVVVLQADGTPAAIVPQLRRNSAWGTEIYRGLLHVAADDDGGYFLLGDFNEVDGQLVGGFVRIQADGTLDRGLAEPAPRIASPISSYRYFTALTVDPARNVYVAGMFNAAGNDPRDGIARYSPRSFDVRVLTPAAATVAGGSIELAVQAVGRGPFAYRWLRNGSVMAGATQAQLRISPVATGDATTYVCEVTAAQTTVRSGPMTVSLGAPPSFTVEPVSIETGAAGPATLTASVSGDPAPSLQWHQNGSAIAGAASASLSVAPRPAPAGAGDGSGLYELTATNPHGTARSRAARVILATAPQVTYLSPSRTVTAGESVAVEIHYKGHPAPVVTFLRNGQPVAATPAVFYSFADATGTATLLLSPVSAAEAGAYSVVLRNSAGAVSSSASGINVVAPTGTPPIITQGPSSQSVAEYSHVFLTVTATNALSYQWLRNGQPIAAATSSYLNLLSFSDPTSPSYTVRVGNLVGSVTSAPAILTLRRTPYASVLPYSGHTVLPGARVVFAAQVTGLPPPTVQWQKNGADLPGATSATLVINAAQPGDAGDYRVRVSNGSTSTTSMASSLRVVAAATSALAASATRALGGLARHEVFATFVIEGTQPKSLLIRAIGPGLAGFGVANAMADPHVAVFDNLGRLIAQNDRWDAAPDLAALHAATARSGAFALTAGTRDAAVTVTLAPGAYHAVFGSAPPASTPRGIVLAEIYETDHTPRIAYVAQRVPLGTAENVAVAGFTVLDAARPYLIRVLGPAILAGVGNPRFELFGADSAPVARSDNGSDPAAATIATRLGLAPLAAGGLEAATVQTLGIGTYTLVAHHAAGPGSFALIEIAEADTLRSTPPPPAVVAPPLSRQVPTGGSVQLEALVTGQPVSYQWRRDGSDIIGATLATLELTNVQPAQGAGSYTVRITNAAGTAESMPAVITAGGQAHSADTNLDNRLSLAELTRMIALYNTRAGTARTGRYAVQTGSEDGFAPDPTPLSETTPALGRFHSADTDRNGVFSLVEMTRVIELYNTRRGTARTGAFRHTGENEDGFSAGP